jgi:predicted DNA-binding ribbon-helix-helix protein
MTVLDVVNEYRLTQAVFKKYEVRAGECILCKRLFDSLEELANRYGLDLNRLMEELESAAAHQEADTAF